MLEGRGEEREEPQGHTRLIPCPYLLALFEALPERPAHAAKKTPTPSDEPPAPTGLHRCAGRPSICAAKRRSRLAAGYLRPERQRGQGRDPRPCSPAMGGAQVKDAQEKAPRAGRPPAPRGGAPTSGVCPVCAQRVSVGAGNRILAHRVTCRGPWGRLVLDGPCSGRGRVALRPLPTAPPAQAVILLPAILER